MLSGNFPPKRVRRLRSHLLVAFLIASLLYVEFVFFVNSTPTGPIRGLAIYLNPKGNELENAIGKLAITDEAHLLLKGEGKFELKIYDSKGTLILTRNGRFNNTGFADISFQLSPDKFKVGEKYTAVLEAFNEPLPLILKCSKTKIKFKVCKDVTNIGIGFYKNPLTNETFVFAKLTDESGPIEGRKIRFEYKHYAANESFKNLGEALTDEQGKAEVKLNINDTQLIVIKAEFEGDKLYEPSATSEVYTSQVNIDLLATYLNGKIKQKTSNIGKQGSIQNDQKQNSNTESENATELATRSSKLITLSKLSHLKACLAPLASIKVSVKPAGSDSVKLDGSDGDDSGDSWSDLNIEFDFEQMTLAEFLDKIAMDDSPASLLVDIAEIMSNPCDLPYVVHKLQIILSKLSIALIPMIDDKGIVLYRVEIHEVVKKVAKQVTETVTEFRSKWVKRTKTVYKKVAKRVRVWRKLVKWVRERRVITYRYWVPWHWVTVRQVYYVWVPKIQWKAFWKTIYEAVKETVTYWAKVTEAVTKTVTKTIYETVKETVKENVNVYRLKVLEGKVIDLKTNKEYDMAEWFLTLIGIDVKTLRDITKDEKNPMDSFVWAFRDLLGSLINSLTNLATIIVNILKNNAVTFMEMLLRQPFSELWGKALLAATITTKKKSSSGIQNTFQDVDFEDFNLIRDVSVVYQVGKKCDVCDKYHYLAEGTKFISDVAEYWLRMQKAMRQEEPMAQAVITTRILCKLEDGKFVWINVRRLNVVEDDKGNCKIVFSYKGMETEVKPLGIVRRTILVYHLDGNGVDGEMKVTPVIQVIVSSWAEEKMKNAGEDFDGRLLELQSNLENYGKVEKKTFDTEETMYIVVPTSEEHVENMLKGLGHEEDTTKVKVDPANVRVLGELCIGDLDKLTEWGRKRVIRDEVRKFFVPVDEETQSGLLNRIYNLHFEVAEETCREGGKLMNIAWAYNAAGEHESDGKPSLVFFDFYVYSWLGKLLLCPELLKTPEKLKEIYDLETNLQQKLKKYDRKYKDGRYVGGACNFFYFRVYQLEYIARLCGLSDEEVRLKFEGIGEVTLTELKTMRKELADVASSKGVTGRIKALRENYFDKNERAVKVFLQVCGFESLEDVESKKVYEVNTPKFLYEDLVKDFTGSGEKFAMSRLFAMTITADLMVQKYLVGKSMMMTEFMKVVETEFQGWKIKEETEQNVEIKPEDIKLEGWDVPHLARQITGMDPIEFLLSKMNFDKVKENLEEIIKDDKVREEVGSRLNKISERLSDHVKRMDLVREQLKFLKEEFKDSKGYATGVLQFYVFQFLFIAGVFAALDLVKVRLDFFAWLAGNEMARLALGVALTAISIIGFNFEGDWIKAVANPKKFLKEAFEKSLREQIGKASSSGWLKEALTPDKSCTIAAFFTGFAMVIRELGIPFYTSEELCDRFCEWVKTINHEVGEVLHKILSIKIPSINQSIFDLMIGFILGGPAEILGDAVIGTVVQQVLVPIINSVVVDFMIALFTGWMG